MNGILKRKLLYVKVRFISPLNVSSGENEWTDSDVLRDYEGNPFVAGSSLAGAMRAYIEKKKTESCLMGFSKPAGRQNISDSGKMSSLFISDLNFDGGLVYGVRDNVDMKEAYNDCVEVVNYITYDENDLMTIQNYRLKEVQ